MGRQRHTKKPTTEVETCPICSGTTEGFHFGILSCRPCASFFRRTVASKHIYTCSLNSNCLLDHTNRTMCKGCRFNQCIKSGMNPNQVQYNRDPIGSKKQQKVSGKKALEYNVPSTSSTMSNLSSSSEETPLLQKMLNSYKNYCRSEKSLYSLLFPDNPVNSDNEYQLVKHTEFIRLERGNLSFMYTMLNDWCPTFGTSLPSSIKMDVFQSIFRALMPIIKSYRTALIFPDCSDPRIFLAYGQYISLTELEDHFQTDPDPKEATKINFDMCMQTRRTGTKMNRLNVTDMEFIALAGIIFCNEVSVHCPAFPDVSQMHEQLIQELYEYIVQTYGQKKVGPRMGALILLLTDFDLLRRYVIEAVTICRVFNAHEIEVFD